ncbi:hypothetical protein [Shewanella glacialipiscicola]|uniref:hypothetical protein n=1 Tax=Shewanella glacialipiscicola TaxID=614069 RepID=UPI003D7A20DB
MIKPLDNITLKAPVSMRAILTVDADIDAERIIVMDRETSEVYYNFKIANPINMFVVPYKHALNSTLLVGILDDNTVYNCKFIDGVTSENININAM